MKNLCITLALLVCYVGTMAQTRKLFGVNSGVFSVNTDGTDLQAVSALPSEPAGGLTLYQGKLYGVTRSGGDNDVGTIYRTNLDGSGLEIVHHLDVSTGAVPFDGLTVANEYLWGTVSTGSDYDEGVIYLTYNGAPGIANQHFFVLSEYGGATSQLVEANGRLWGTSYLHGANNAGAVFSFDPSSGSDHQLEYTFTTAEGSNHKGRLLSFGGYLWGVAEEGGANGLGTIYKIDLSDQSYAKVRDLANADGTNPVGGLVEIGGLLIGMTQNGGANGLGTVFTIDPDDDSFTKTIDLSETTGGNPLGALTAFDGLLYGLASSEGENGLGTFFSLTADGETLTVLQNFSVASGGSPVNTTLLAVNQPPTVVEIPEVEFDEDSEIQIDLSEYFDDLEDGGDGLTYVLDSSIPFWISSVTIDGPIMTVEVYENQFGEFDMFITATDGNDQSVQGELPLEVNPVVDDPSTSPGSTTYLNKSENGPYLYRSNVDGSEVTHAKITGLNNGTLFTPGGTQIDEGEFVALDDITSGLRFLPTALGEISFNAQLATGSDDDDLGGSIIQVTVTVEQATPIITWVLQPEIPFGDPLSELHLNASAPIDGTFTYNPAIGTVLYRSNLQVLEVTFEPEDSEHYLPVTVTRNTSVYGESTLVGMGGAGGGNIFSYRRGASSVTTVSSDLDAIGENPNGEFLKIDGRLYGTMQSGGANGYGAIFSMTPHGTDVTTLHDFDGVNGSKPVRRLYYDYATELFWGVTYEGGANDFGTIFSLEKSGENFVKRHDFDGANGKYPDAGFNMFFANELFATTTEGGDGYGLIYKINVENGEYEVIRDFASDECATPRGELHTDGFNIWGVAEEGGEHGYGAIFKILRTGEHFGVAHSFDGADGSSPLSGMTYVNNYLWGTTGSGGGVGKSGTIFRFTPFADEFIVAHRFPTTGTTAPTGQLSLIDGRLWGMTSQGGPNNHGGLFHLLTTISNYDFHELVAFSTDDGAGHINGTVAFAGTPPYLLEPATLTLYEDQSANGYQFAVFNDDEDFGNLTYTLLSSTNSELIQLSLNGTTLDFTLAENQFGHAEMEIEASDPSGETVSTTVQIEVLPVPDKPSITSPTTMLIGQFNEDGLVVTRNEADGEECTHFKVLSIYGGELYYHDEVTQINEGDYVPYSEGALGLKGKVTSEGLLGFAIRSSLGDDDDSMLSTEAESLFFFVSRQSSNITWPTPETIYVGTPLSEVQLNATCDVPGTFTYDPPLGEVLPYGFYILTVSFVPDQPNAYNEAEQTVQLWVEKRLPVITWENPPAVVFGMPLTEEHLNASADVEGAELQYTTSDGDVISVGTVFDFIGSELVYVNMINFDEDLYFTPATVLKFITVSKGTPDILWEPEPIVYGEPLGEHQLNAVSDEGLIIFDHFLGEFFGPGVYLLTATFYPNDPDKYDVTFLSAELVVEKAIPVINWETPASITYGTQLTDQLNATADLDGTFTYSISQGDILDVGTHTITVEFIPDDDYYNTASAAVLITVLKADPLINWPAGSVGVTSPLTADHFSATASVAGTFAYHQSVGALLPGGTHTLTADFTPADVSRYNTKTVTTTLTVVRRNPVVTWSGPAGIVYGTPLGNTQLNATADVPGVFGYSPPIGQVLDAGTRILTVEFSPTDAALYSTTTASVTIQVAKVNQTISSFATLPTNLKFGDQPIDLSAVASSGLAVVFASSNENVIRVNGAVATIVGAGTAALTASQPGNTNYNAAPVPLEQVVSVAKVNQVITFQTVDDKTLGDAAFLLTASSTSSQAIGFSTASDKIALAGGSVTIVKAGRATITASQPAAANYFAAAVDRSFCIKPARPVVTANNTNPDSPVLTSSSSSGNQWFLNGTAITGATSQTHTVAAGGEYTVQVSADDCTSQPSAPVRFLVTALAEASGPAMSIYPNPASDEIHIVWNSVDVEDRTIMLYDMLGREVERRAMDGDELMLDVRTLGGGTYMILGIQGTNRFQQRFVKE